MNNKINMKSSFKRFISLRHNWLKNTAAVIIGISVSFLLAELLVLLVVGEIPKFPRRVVEAPWGIRYNDPGARYRHKSADGTWHFRINNQGMRADRDYTYQKQPGVKRILSLGDSFTLGFEVDGEDTYSSVVERNLNFIGIQTEVLNTGVSGFSNAEEYLYLERELLNYNPDLVIISFWINDFMDNIRTGLFQLDGNSLIRHNQRYVPLGSLGNFFNTNMLSTFLSERSNAFVFLKQSLIGIAKRWIETQKEKEIQLSPNSDLNINNTYPLGDIMVNVEKYIYVRRLTATIFNHFYNLLRQRNIPMIILSIPTPYWDRSDPLVEEFPLEYFDIDRPGITFVSGKGLLDSHVSHELLYWQQSQVHWTPFSHEQAGKAIAELILDHNLLGKINHAVISHY
ncbi:SGNH/GDSL hydrolase family protein [candidate division KSB1 bacterium]|nr:SGNH/GDSL hydrolase family protein [candidate division KSB1 bacterium]